jgi:hypothetical protein
MSNQKSKMIAEAVASLVPKHPKNFGMTDNEALYFPVCLASLNEGLDIDFIESTFQHCGIIKRV